VVGPDGAVVYYSDMPEVVVRTAGPVDATATFTPVAFCTFQLCVYAEYGSTCELKSERGPGPTLSVSGTVTAGRHHVLVDARSEGVSLCSSVPTGGAPFTYHVTVVHP